MEMSGKLHAAVPLAPGKKPRYPVNRGWVGPKADMVIVEKTEISFPCIGDNVMEYAWRDRANPPQYSRCSGCDSNPVTIGNKNRALE